MMSIAKLFCVTTLYNVSIYVSVTLSEAFTKATYIIHVCNAPLDPEILYIAFTIHLEMYAHRVFAYIFTRCENHYFLFPLITKARYLRKQNNLTHFLFSHYGLVRKIASFIGFLVHI